METAADPIIAADSRGIITLCNRRAEALFGYRAGELVGKPLISIMPERFRDGHRKGMERLLSTGKPTIIGKSVELTGLRKDDSEFPLELSVGKSGAGEEIFFAAVIRDISERKRMEQALAERRGLLQAEKDLLEAIMENTEAHLAYLDPQFNFIRVNSTYAKGSGHSAGELIGRNHFEPFPNEENQAIFEKVRDTGEPVEFRAKPFEFADQPWRGITYWDWTLIPIKGDSGQVQGLVLSLLDVTERIRAQEALREYREDLDRAQAMAHTGSWRLDVRRNELRWSNETYRMFGIPKGTPLTYETLLEAVHPEDREYVDQEWKAALRGEPYDIEHRIVVGDTVRWVRERAELEFDKDGTLLGGFGTVQDITERKQAEEALERLRSEFVGIVTHELKTPLTAIKGSAATALGSHRPLTAEENRELFEIIDEQADRLRELMDDLLDVTRIEAGALSVSPEPTDLQEILEEARATFARGGGLHDIRLEVPVDIPHVHADRRRLSQVLMNLLHNAAAFSPPTEAITIAVEHDSLRVTVHVRDRGRGIPKDKLPLLFKKFSRLHDDAGQKPLGTGLGLVICKGIVEAHGGRIWADSAGVGQGSTFSFTLLVASETSVEVLPDEARKAMHLRCKHPGRVRRPGERTRVLAVDDEPQVLRYLRRCLDGAGYQPVTTDDPSEVAKLLELEEPELVLLDLMLPGTSGFDLLQRIREFSGVPVIFLTASDREEDAVRALKMGADDYITKPFSPSELLARIEAALRRRLLPDVMEAGPPFVLGDLTVNFAERRVSLAGREVSLSATEYKILYALATNAGRPMTYQQILHQVWGPEYSGETELVRSFIRNLRRKLGDDAPHPRFILTERQVGYRMPKP